MNYVAWKVKIRVMNRSNYSKSWHGDMIVSFRGGHKGFTNIQGLFSIWFSGSIIEWKKRKKGRNNATRDHPKVSFAVASLFIPQSKSSKPFHIISMWGLISVLTFCLATKFSTMQKPHQQGCIVAIKIPYIDPLVTICELPHAWCSATIYMYMHKLYSHFCRCGQLVRSIMCKLTLHTIL